MLRFNIVVDRRIKKKTFRIELVGDYKKQMEKKIKDKMELHKQRAELKMKQDELLTLKNKIKQLENDISVCESDDW